jgi:hypothetical protein
MGFIKVFPGLAPPADRMALESPTLAIKHISPTIKTTRAQEPDLSIIIGLDNPSTEG